MIIAFLRLFVYLLPSECCRKSAHVAMGNGLHSVTKQHRPTVLTLYDSQSMQEECKVCMLRESVC